MNKIGFEAAAAAESVQQQQLFLAGHMQYPNNAVNVAQAHTMPPPTTAPWNLDSMPWKLASTDQHTMTSSSGVMQFSAEKMAEAIDARRTIVHQKRKSNTLITALPTKQFISEEKIAAHFNGLHISSDYIQNTNSTGSSSTSMGVDADGPSTSGRCFANLTYHDYQVTSKELEEKLRNANRITVCEEIRKLQDEHKKVSFIPEALLGRVERPCTALVLWQPPPVTNLLQTQQQQQNERNTKVARKSDNLEDYNENTNAGNNMGQDAEFDDFIDNNNTSRLDFNNLSADSMDEDL